MFHLLFTKIPKLAGIKTFLVGGGALGRGKKCLFHMQLQHKLR